MALHWVALLIVGWVVLIGLAVGLVVALRRIQCIERRYFRLVEGASAERLEEILLEHIDQIQANRQAVEQLADRINSQLTAQARAIQHLGLVQFNPYEDTGGQLSFALALADGEGSGAVLCSLHGRGNTRLYVKPIVDWSSPVMLGDEEQRAVALLRKNGSRKE